MTHEQIIDYCLKKERLVFDYAYEVVVAKYPKYIQKEISEVAI